MCFVHKHMQNADFGPACDVQNVTWPRDRWVRFSQTWYQKMRKTWKKKSHEKVCVAICGGREAVADFVQGGSNWPPPQLR